MTAVHPEAALYEAIVNDSAAFARVDTVAKVQELIDELETYVPHDQLPPCYEALLRRRIFLEKKHD